MKSSALPPPTPPRAAGLHGGRTAAAAARTCKILRALRMSPLERVTRAFIPSSVTSTLENRTGGCRANQRCRRETQPWKTKPAACPCAGEGGRRGRRGAHPSSWMTCRSRGTISSGVRGPKRKRVQRDCRAGMILER